MVEAEGVEPGFGEGMKGVEEMVAYAVSELLIHSNLCVPHPRFEIIADEVFVDLFLKDPDRFVVGFA